MESNEDLHARYVLQKLLVNNESFVTDEYPWVWEHERWKELVFAILTQACNHSHEDIRYVTDQLDLMGLLDLRSLAAIPVNKADDLKNDKHAFFISDFMLDHGFDKKEIKRSIVAMSELARGLEKNYEGKIQQYLRAYGEVLLKDVSKKFNFTSLNGKETRYAFVYWLQNVLNMPISLDDNIIDKFSKENGLKANELIKAADDMGINLAFLDDLIRDYWLANDDKN